MTKLKRLATKEDEIVDVKIPISNEELKDRAKQYDLLTPKRFATRYNKMLFLPTSLNGTVLNIPFNIITASIRFVVILGKNTNSKM